MLAGSRLARQDVESIDPRDGDGVSGVRLDGALGRREEGDSAAGLGEGDRGDEIVTQERYDESIGKDDGRRGGREQKMERPDVGRVDDGFVADSDGLDEGTGLVEEKKVVDEGLGSA